jgi:hypothetical protein
VVSLSEAQTKALRKRDNAKGQYTTGDWTNQKSNTNAMDDCLDERQMCGPTRFMIRLEGISNRMYGAKKMVRATLGCTPESPRSFGRPMVKAFPMLTLGRWVYR